jgi:hypothetical protein
LLHIEYEKETNEWLSACFSINISLTRRGIMIVQVWLCNSIFKSQKKKL